MLISPSPATLERHTDALLLAATTDDAHDDAQLMRRAALEALNVLDLRLVEQYAARRGAECVASFRFLAALDPVEPPSTTIGRQRAYLAKKGAEVLVETKTEAAPAAAADAHRDDATTWRMRTPKTQTARLSSQRTRDGCSYGTHKTPLCFS